MNDLARQVLFLLAGAAILIGSGTGIVWLVRPLRRTVRSLAIIPIALLLSSGLCGILAIAGTAAGLSITAWSLGVLALSLILLAAGSLARRRDRSPAAMDGVPRPFVRLLLLLSLAAGIWTWFHGGALGPVHDSLDFVAFVNETLQTEELNPRSPIYLAGEEIAADPRRGSFHTQVAAICRISGTHPTDGWRWLPRLLVPLAILSLGMMLRAWIGTRAAALATLFFIATTFFTVDRFIQNLGYASRFGWVVGWASLLALAEGLALRRRSAGREGRALLVIAAAGPALLLPVHILSGFQTLLALGCAGLAVWVVRGAEPRERRETAIVLGVAILLMVPTLIPRLLAGTSVSNPLFDHLYGVLRIAPGWPVLLPGYVVERFGIAGIAGALLGLSLLPSARERRAAGFLALSTTVSLGILFFPPIVRIVLAAHAHSMLFRVILTIPFAGTLAYCTLEAIDGLRAGRLRTRFASVLTLAIVAAGLIGQAVLARSSWMVPERYRAAYRESAPLMNALAFLEDRIDSVQTILADPITSYAIPAYTRHAAVSPLHQHSSPADPNVGRRIRDVQEALNGRVGKARTLRILRRYDVDLILLNQSFKRYQSSYFVYLSPLAYGEQHAKFDGSPEVYERIYDADGIAIYRVHDPGDDGLPAPEEPPNPHRLAHDGAPALLSSGGVDLLRFAVGVDSIPNDGIFPCPVAWRRTEQEYVLPVVCEVKAQMRDLPRTYARPVLGRISLLWDEWRGAGAARFGRAFRPLAPFYPDFLWATGECYADTLWMPVLPGARPGDYDVWIRLRGEPYAPVADLQEIWSTRMGGDWLRAGRIEILPAE